jgi:hypothetical protein
MRDDRQQHTRRVTLALSDLGRDNTGVVAVREALACLVGVRYVYTCAAMEMAYVVYDPALLRPDQLVTALQQAGIHADPPEPR